MERASILSFLLCVSTNCFATTWYVDDDGKADFERIQDAIDASIDMDVIFVREGTYYENIDFLGKWIQVQGENRDTTIIDGSNHNGSVVTCNSGETFWSVLSSFTIQNGSGTYWVDPVFGQQKCGGGIFCEDASPFIEMCLIKDNQAWGGAGIFVTSGDPYIMTSTIKNNTAEGHGGGIYCIYNVNASITNIVLEGNEANWGGGITCTDESNPNIANCTFAMNTTLSVGGGIYIRSTSSPVVTDCSFVENVQISNPLGSGGGACIYGGGSTGGPCSPTFTDCSFFGNTVNGDGAGMSAAYDAHPKVTNCTFEQNHAGRSGGGLACVADDGHIYESNADVQDCSFEGNSSAEEGGGIHVRFSSPTISGVQVTNNTAGNTGGGINFHDSPNTMISNSTICENLPNPTSGNFTDGGGNIFSDACFVCEGDANEDGMVDVTDLLAAVGNWGPCEGCSVDIDGNGVVDVTDLLIIVGNWGSCN
jgi:predicted outer membrane repeat protein